MKVQTVTTVVVKVLSGAVKTSNGAEFHYEPSGSGAVVKITRSRKTGSDAYFNEESCREAAEFFTNLGKALAGRPTEEGLEF